jgi:hypothetical protein
MNLNALLIRGAVFMALAMILAFTSPRHVPAAHAQTATAEAPVAAAVVLPVVELPTISVRPSAADLMAARAGSEDSSGGGLMIEAAATESLYETLTPNLPSLRMDMPYYSFGKALRHGVKE